MALVRKRRSQGDNKNKNYLFSGGCFSSQVQICRRKINQDKIFGRNGYYEGKMEDFSTAGKVKVSVKELSRANAQADTHQLES